MRVYKDKNNRQKKDYYNDRFFIAKSTAKEAVKGSAFQDFEEKLSLKMNILTSFIELDTWVIEINSSQNIQALNILKELGFDLIIELSAIDFIEKRGGFEVFYQLLNMKAKKRARLKLFIKKDEKLQSVCSVYMGANWPEREMYDMYGIRIVNHPRLKRILMPDDWYGHPLLKSYPLEGDEFAAWYEIDKIFGKEYREVVGPENRDPGKIVEKDSFNFSKIYHETPKGLKRPKEAYVEEYQEKGGVPLMRRLQRKDVKIIKKRP